MERNQMSKTIKVFIEKEDEILELEGDEAEKWAQHCESVCFLAANHSMNPFDSDPVKWKTTKKPV